MEISLNFLIFILGFLFYSKLFAGDVLKIEKNFESKAIGRNLRFFLDEKNENSFETLLKNQHAIEWKSIDQENPNFGFIQNNQSVWAKIEIVNSDVAAKNLILESNNPGIDLIEIYQLNGVNYTKLSAGDHVSRSLWQNKAHFPRFEIPLNRSTVLFIKLSGTSSIQFSFNLFDKEFYQEFRLKRETTQGLFFGGLVTIIIYNLLIGISAKFSLYCHYVGFLLSYLIFQLIYLGYFSSLISYDLPASLIEYLMWLSVACCANFYHIFSAKILNIDEKWNIFVFMKKYFQFMIFLTLPVYVYLGYKYSLITGFIGSTLPWAISSAYYSFKSFKKNKEMTIIFASAMTVFLIGSLFVPLKSLGLVPSNVITDNMQQIGSSIEFLALSLALAKKIKSLEKEISQESIEKEKIKSTYKEKLLMEVENKLELSADAAHRINNPLNHISLDNSLISTEIGKIEILTLSLLGTYPSQDHDTFLIQTEYFEKISKIKHSNKIIEYAVKKIVSAINEIRLMSGLNGFDRNYFELEDLVDAIKSKIGLYIEEEFYHRLKISISTHSDLKLLINIEATSYALVQIILMLLNHADLDKNIEFKSQKIEGFFQLLVALKSTTLDTAIVKKLNNLNYLINKFGGILTIDVQDSFIFVKLFSMNELKNTENCNIN